MIDKRFLVHGFLPAIAAACSFAMMAGLVKLASADVPLPVLVFLRNLAGLAIILPVVLPRGRRYLKTKKLKMHMFRSLISLCAITSFFYALGHIGLAEASLLNATSPLFIGILATLILGESLNRALVLSLLTGFIGVALILKPGTELFTLAALAGLASGFFIACAKIIIRYMASTEPVLRTVFYFSLLTTIYSAVPLLWLWQTPSPRTFIIMVLAGMTATLGQTFLTYAYTHNRAVKVAPFTYITVLAAGLIGWWIWNEIPDAGSSIGALLVIAACLVITLEGKPLIAWKKKPPPAARD